MKIKGWDLDFFSTGEWQVCDERLKDLEKVNRPYSDGYNPGRGLLFESLRRIPFEEVRCIIVGQDPYPDRRFATGVAFSIPGDFEWHDWPPTIRTLLKEYSTDLGLPVPHRGVLDKWCTEGVLLWNAIPSCGRGKSLSHDWEEWEGLTKEIVTKLSQRGVVHAFLGGVARRYSDIPDLRNNRVICTSHPSPRGSIKSKNPFVGSRLFSTINARLNELCLPAVDWVL